MIWLNDRLAERSAAYSANGEAFEFFPVLPGVLVDPVTARLTPTQKRILDYLTDKAPATVAAFELRDEIAPDADEGNIRVQVHKMRKAGAAIESTPGPHGGYRVAVSA